MSLHLGQHLAELPRHYHALRGPFLKWAEPYDQPATAVLGNLQRALIGWYEAVIDPTEPYTGSVNQYVQQVGKIYFSGKLNEAVRAAEQHQLSDSGLTAQQNPLHHLPRPLHLNSTQQLMLTQFKALGNNCQNLLLMADYHRLTPGRIAEILELEDRLEQVADRRDKCLLMAREAWQAGGILDPTYSPSPVDEALIDQYYAGQLGVTERWDVEARRPVDPVFRKAMELREDWAGVVTVAGRQDLLETLLREEARYAAAATSSAPASAQKKVKLSPRRKGGIQIGSLELPDLQTIVASILFLAFAWLAWTTFGPRTISRKAVDHFEPLPNLFERVAPRNESERDLKRILYYYDRGDYQTAYDELLPTAQAYPAAPLYLGISALALKQPGRALDWFDQIPAGSYYHPFAEWYEALAYLAEGKKPAAELLLEDISRTNGHPYRGKARELLEEI